MTPQNGVLLSLNEREPGRENLSPDTFPSAKRFAADGMMRGNPFLSRPEQEGHDLTSGAGIVGREPVFPDAVGYTVRRRP